MNPIYSFEGNIGSGKSTLIDILRKENKLKNVVYLEEPVKLWKTIKDTNGETILEKFYSNQEKYSFSFQMMAYISRLSELKKKIKENPDKIIFTERSILTDKNVFAKMLYDDKKIEEINYAIYLKWFDEYMNDFNFCGIIYVQTSPEICNKRIKLRNRKGEESIPIEYSIKCDYYHNEWINNLKKINGKPSEKIYFDGNINFKNNIPEEWYEELELLISKHNFENEEKWTLTKSQYLNLKKGTQFFDHYIYYEKNDQKITQKDCFSNNFV